MLTQKQILANQVTMGLLHLSFSFKQTMMKGKNFLQSHLQATSLKIKKNWYRCLLNILQSKIYTLHNLKMNLRHLLLLIMCHQQCFHLTTQQLLKSSSGSLFMQKISHQNYSVKMFNTLDGLHIMHSRNVAYKLHQVSVLFFHYYEIRLVIMIAQWLFSTSSKIQVIKSTS